MNRLIERLKELRATTGGSTAYGWMFDEVALLLYSIVTFYRPQLVIQTGHLWGKSALVILEALTGGLVLDPIPQTADPLFSAFVESHRPTADWPVLMSIDPGFESVPHGDAGVKLLQTWYPQNFRFIPGRSADFFNQYGPVLRHRPDWPSITKMSVIDGDHSVRGCLEDLNSSRKLGASVIFLDDIDWLPHIGEVGQAFARLNHYHWLPLHMNNGVALLVSRPLPTQSIS